MRAPRSVSPHDRPHGRGPRRDQAFSELGVNSFENFAVDKAKQFVACNHDGYVIGDAIRFHLDEDRLRLVGRPSAHNWVQYHAQTGDYEVTVRRDERTAANPAGRRELYRYQPGSGRPGRSREGRSGTAARRQVLQHCVIQVAGRTVRALHHGMSGAPGLELFGPWEEAEEVKAAIVEAESDFGLRQVGARVYPTNTLESGWIPSPLPAVFTGEEMRAYRQWLPADGYEATGSLGGSFSSDDITDLYLTPHDLGYWSLTKLDHDFIGREALESLGDKHERRKVTLARNGDDVRRAMGTMFAKGDPVKYIDLPLSNYATWPYDKVLLNGDVVGVSTFSGYSYNERSMLSLAVLDSDVPIGAEVTLVWGEAGGGSAKPVVERHVQAEFRAVVSPCPYSEVIRASYGGESRRTRATVA